MFEVGERVIVRNDLTQEEKGTSPLFVPEMEKYAGEELIVKEKTKRRDCDGIGYVGYYLEVPYGNHKLTHHRYRTFVSSFCFREEWLKKTNKELVKETW